MQLGVGPLLLLDRSPTALVEHGQGRHLCHLQDCRTSRDREDSLPGEQILLQMTEKTSKNLRFSCRKLFSQWLVHRSTPPCTDLPWISISLVSVGEFVVNCLFLLLLFLMLSFVFEVCVCVNFCLWRRACNLLKIYNDRHQRGRKRSRGQKKFSRMKKIEINLQNLILTWSSLKKKINVFFWEECC